MQDLDELRELLQGKAESLPPAGPAPRPMLRRVRRRVAVTVTTGLLVLAAAAFGSYTGITALAGRQLTPKPAHTPSISVTPPPSPSGTVPGGLPTPCGPQDLLGRSLLSGAAGSQVGSLEFSSALGGTCPLAPGRPTVTIVAPDGTTIGTTHIDADPWWKVNGKPQPTGWPQTIVSPGNPAVFRFAWTSGCTVPQGSHFAVRLPGSNVVVSVPIEGIPGCLSSSRTPSLQIGPLEPASDTNP